MTTKREPGNSFGPAPGDVDDAIFTPPPGSRVVPGYRRGWFTDGDAGAGQPYLQYVAGSAVNWSDELEALHEEASRTHFLDRWTRNAITQRIADLTPESTIADIGCSTGFLLEDVLAAHPRATAVGIDLIAAGLIKTHQRLPEARLLQADACALPLRVGSVDAIVSANLLEHVPEDVQALREFARILRPGGRAVIVVPAGPQNYDYYDRFLGHERRYAHGELASKCTRAGLEIVEDLHLGAMLYPAFWLVKQRNRRRYGRLDEAALGRRVWSDISHTRASQVGELAWRLEDRLVKAGLRPRFGIRSLVVARRPGARR